MNDIDEYCTEFSILPAHIVTKILGYLKLEDFKNASCVCKAWYYASTDPQIVKTLILQGSEQHLSEICKSHRKYGILKLQYFDFNKPDSYYYEYFEKFVPFIYEIYILDCDLNISHLLRILQLAKRLKVLAWSGCCNLEELPGLFPIDYDDKPRNEIIKNLTGIHKIVIDYFINIPFISDLFRYTINLDTFEFSNEFIMINDVSNENPYKQFFTIFDNDYTDRLKRLHLHLNFSGCADDFIIHFVRIKNLNIRSFRITIWWIWENEMYKSALFRQFVMKLQSLFEFSIYGLGNDQLALICQYLVNLKRLDCLVGNDQPISNLSNLKQLKELRCRVSLNTFISAVEIDKFFKCKFENLRLLNFEDFVNEPNLLHLCENHPNLIELKLTRLVTRNLEIIFKHLTKLRVLVLYFGFTRLVTGIGDSVPNTDSDQEYQYKISRLQDLEEFYLGELVNGIRESDVSQLKKLKSTNLPRLFSR